MSPLRSWCGLMVLAVIVALVARSEASGRVEESGGASVLERGAMHAPLRNLLGDRQWGFEVTDAFFSLNDPDAAVPVSSGFVYIAALAPALIMYNLFGT
ncbi:hypothetical protein BSKO_08929 [Bryopsis sp. KO-2023]|nr:hypothetical protein BSKO_08929 [Bryopsis sp. KO-2023]